MPLVWTIDAVATAGSPWHDGATQRISSPTIRISPSTTSSGVTSVPISSKPLVPWPEDHRAARRPAADLRRGAGAELADLARTAGRAVERRAAAALAALREGLAARARVAVVAGVARRRTFRWTRPACRRSAPSTSWRRRAGGRSTGPPRWRGSPRRCPNRASSAPQTPDWRGVLSSRHASGVAALMNGYLIQTASPGASAAQVGVRSSELHDVEPGAWFTLASLTSLAPPPPTASSMNQQASGSFARSTRSLLRLSSSIHPVGPLAHSLTTTPACGASCACAAPPAAKPSTR